MKKIIMVLMVVIALGMIGEGLYTALATFDISQSATTSFSMADAYPYELPVFAIDPCIDCAMF